MPTTRLRIPMRARPIDEPHRASSPLELLFDLTFVVAVAAVTAELAHSIAAGHAEVLGFLQVFFAIWWAWMNFTWFASSYDTDDLPYRLLTMVQMAGVLVLAAGVPAAAATGDYRTVLIGYLIMRAGLLLQWLRAAYEDRVRRRTALRYAVGIVTTQVGWALALVFADLALPYFIALVMLELAVPLWAEWRHPATNWHPHHIAERYGLFVIILLGESVLAASRGVEAAVTAHAVDSSFVLVAGAGLVLLFALWWLYFLHPAGEGLSERRAYSYHWGYGHYFLFAALAALGAGLEVAVEHTAQNIGYAVALPVAVFLAMVWLVHAQIINLPVMRREYTLISVVIVLALPLVLSTVGVVVGCAAVVVLLVAVVLSQPGHRQA
ncbi:low temperature requirement protein A [Kribbella sp. NPDC051587]|uniref:low temperature requirement protein A n=1 Tax=Kribbella sp. NPDC051587 TaxID=3364119 RepID=UPI0037B0153F